MKHFNGFEWQTSKKTNKKRQNDKQKHKKLKQQQYVFNF